MRWSTVRRPAASALRLTAHRGCTTWVTKREQNRMRMCLFFPVRGWMSDTGSVPSIAVCGREVNMLKLTRHCSRLSLALAGALTVGGVSAGETSEKPNSYQPLRPLSECLDPSRARAFMLVDGDRLLVDAGRRHYLIELRWSCPSLYNAASLDFRSRNAAGRICGDIEEQVSAPANPALHLDRCRIAKVTRITRDEYRDEVNGNAHRLSTEVGKSSKWAPDRREFE